MQRAMQRRLSWLAALSVAIVLAACRSHPATHAPLPGSAAAHPGAAAQTPAVASAASAASAQAAPAVRVAAAPGKAAEVAIRVQNRASQIVQVASVLSVERRVEQGFRPLPGAEIALEAAVGGDGCVRLAPGAELQPSPWQRGAQAGEGTYRFVLRACDGSYRIDGEPFEVR